MFGELEDADEPDDAKESERSARLGASAAHRRQHVEERDVVWYDGHDVDDVLEVAPELELRRTGDEAQDRLDGEPGRAGGLAEEEGVEKVGQLAVLAVRHGERRQCLDAEQNDRQQRHQHRPDCHHERQPRRLRELEDHPDAAQRRVARPRHLLGGVAFRPPVLVDGVRFQLVEDQLVEEDVVRNVFGAAQPAAALVIHEDRLETRPVPVEEELAPLAVVELSPSESVAEQRARVAFQHRQRRLEVVAADVDTNPLVGIPATFTNSIEH